MKKFNLKTVRKNLKKGIKKITQHKLFKNKVYSILLMILGFVSIIPEKDITVFIMLEPLAIALWFAKENWITE